MNSAKNTRRPKGDGSIFQAPDGRWIGRLTYIDPETNVRKRSQVSADTKKAVGEKLSALRKRVSAGAPPRDGTVLFGVYASEWTTSTLEASDRKRSTKALYAGLLRTHVVDSALGRTPVGAVTPPAVERFLTELRKKGLSDSTVRQIYTVARTVADTAVRDRLITENPFGKIARPKVAKREAVHLTPAELEILLDAAADSRYAPLFELMASTGLRRGEALALRWDKDVNLTAVSREKPKQKPQSVQVRGTLVRQGGTLVTTTPKSESSYRNVPLTDDAVDLLRAVKARTAADRLRAGSKWVDSGYVFVTEFGEPCDPRNALRAFQACAKRAGIENADLHTLRHTAATRMLNNGAPIAVVSRLLGHASIQITVDIYGHEDDDSSRAAVELLSRRPRSIG